MHQFYYFIARTSKLFFFGVSRQEEFATNYCEILNQLYGIELLPVTNEERELEEYYLITKTGEETIKVISQCCAISFDESPKVNQEMDLVFAGQREAYVYINGSKEDITEFTEKKRNWRPKPNFGIIQIKVNPYFGQ